MSKKISAIDSERIFTQDIGQQVFFEAPRSSKLRPSEGNSLFAATGARALTNSELFRHLEEDLNVLLLGIQEDTGVVPCLKFRKF